MFDLRSLCRLTLAGVLIASLPGPATALEATRSDLPSSSPPPVPGASAVSRLTNDSFRPRDHGGDPASPGETGLARLNQHLAEATTLAAEANQLLEGDRSNRFARLDAAGRTESSRTSDVAFAPSPMDREFGDPLGSFRQWWWVWPMLALPLGCSIGWLVAHWLGHRTQRTLESALDAAGLELQSLDRTRKTLTTNLQSRDHEIAALRQTQHGLQAQLAAAQHHLDQSRTEHVATVESLEVLRTGFAQLKSAVATSGSRAEAADAAEKAKKELTGEVQRLRRALDEASLARSRERTSAQALEHELDNLRQRLEHADKRAEQLEQDRDDLLRQCRARDAELTTLQTRLAASTSFAPGGVASAPGTDKLRADFASSQRALTNAEKLLRDLEEELASQGEQLRAAQRQSCEAATSRDELARRLQARDAELKIFREPETGSADHRTSGDRIFPA